VRLRFCCIHQEIKKKEGPSILGILPARVTAGPLY
jgi:hypothetical protein